MLQKCCTNLGHSVNRIDHLVWREKIIAFEGRFAMRTTRSATMCEWPGMRRELRSVVCHFLGLSESNHTIFKLSKFYGHTFLVLFCFTPVPKNSWFFHSTPEYRQHGHLFVSCETSNFFKSPFPRPAAECACHTNPCFHHFQILLAI